MMSAEKYPTLSFSLRIYFVLILYVSRLEQSSIVQESAPLAAGVHACKSKLLEFFDKSTFDSEYYYFATILDPRFKDSLFQSSDGLASSLFSDDWVSDCANALEDTCNTFYSSEDLDYTKSKPMLPIPLSHTNNANDFAQDWKANLPTCTTYLPPSNSSAVEISKYLREDLTEMSPLVWWRLNAHRFPRLAAMARDYLCIPGTSVAVERVFSAGRDLISVRRASLSAETIRTLMNYRAAIMLEKRIGRPFAPRE
ncbi:hAT family dimerization protein [Rhizoctonia solani AG-3 Rhs1AP]|uniref:HAT family dimerization protein n=1 Tax=Rhizoctonia solani AG-3 Rhs1AP TaxID=1086054 RepID=X8JUB4_9AGAM|nr:hAT family dimerization protein [Rhizoctonia solani AG-3 Rhs1AP]